MNDATLTEARRLLGIDEREARIGGWLERCTAEQLAEIWSQTRPDEPMPDDLVERGYSLFEWFCGC